jgi:hypothetical protein
MRWLEYQDDDDPEEVAVLRWLLSLGEVDRELVIGRIQGLRELAALGEIEDGDEERLKPVRLDPDLWELRWNELGTLLRQYHGEPAALPDALVNLHMHVKRITRSRRQTDALQDQRISFAFMRYRAGERKAWTP